ncbi:MAG: DsbA family protein [Gemmatimonadaceae bacterium]|nr:DsbA family protein [Gemmatimonadaceae bacterium]
MVAKNAQVRKQSRSGFYMLLGVVALAGAGAIGWAVSRPKAIVSKVDPSIPLPKAQGYVKGKADAPVEIIEYADFECPGCGQFAAVTEPDIRAKLIETGEVRFRFMDHPLIELHQNTMAASLAAACANEQGKFWEMHDRIFMGQPDWSSYATSNPRKIFRQYVTEIGADGAAWDKCFDEQKFIPQIEANRNEGLQRGIRGTPTFIVGGRMLTGNPTYDNIKALVDSAKADLASAPQAAATPTAAAPAPR